MIMVAAKYLMTITTDDNVVHLQTTERCMWVADKRSRHCSDARAPLPGALLAIIFYGGRV